jgi:hypothetical protein
MLSSMRQNHRRVAWAALVVGTAYGQDNQDMRMLEDKYTCS